MSNRREEEEPTDALTVFAPEFLLVGCFWKKCPKPDPDRLRIERHFEVTLSVTVGQICIDVYSDHAAQCLYGRLTHVQLADIGWYTLTPLPKVQLDAKG